MTPWLAITVVDRTRTLFRDWMEGGPQATADLWQELGDELVRVRVDDRR